MYERQKAAAAAAARQEAAKETEENKRMVSEELRSWDAYELNIRNHGRMIEKVLASPSGSFRFCLATTSCAPLL